MPPKKELSSGATEALKKFEEIAPFQKNTMDKVRERYRAYQGLMDANSDAASWQSKMHPPYVRNIVRTTLAALLDDKLRFQVKAKPKFYTPEERAAAEQGARAHEILMRFQLSQDHFDEKLDSFVLQSLVAGMTAMKTHWRSDVRRKKSLEVVDVGMQEYGVPGLIHDLQEVEKTETYYAGPCSEVVNLEDFFWHESATDIQKSPIVGHRVWMTYAELKQAADQGIYENVSQLDPNRTDGGDESTSAYDLDGRKRTKDMIEVLELWWQTESGIKTCTLGDRKVELKAPRPNPFWHGEYPFVVASCEPDLFKVQGGSQVQKIAHLQEAVWDFLNQTHDNLRLINNHIVLVNTEMVDDPDANEYAPGEKWEANGPIGEAYGDIKPETITAQVALPHIQMLQNDMQNLAASQPFTSTSEAGRQGADTATEASLVANIAQNSTKAMKQQLLYAYQRIGQQRMELNQQFIRRPIMVEQIGVDSESEFAEIAPQLLQGSFAFDLEPMNESLMRSERRAEANSMLQMFLQIAPLLLPLAQAGAATPLNADAFVEQWLKAYVDDPKPFFSAKPPPAAPAAPGMQQQASPEGMPQGVTAPQAISPATSPSNASSLAPSVMMSRMLSAQGGANNA